MKKKTILLVLLAVVTTANAWAQRGKRAIERIDRDVQTRVFIPKGTTYRHAYSSPKVHGWQEELSPTPSTNRTT